VYQPFYRQQNYQQCIIKAINELAKVDGNKEYCRKALEQNPFTYHRVFGEYPPAVYAATLRSEANFYADNAHSNPYRNAAQKKSKVVGIKKTKKRTKSGWFMEICTQ
jgi:hypothetical protein